MKQKHNHFSLWLRRWYRWTTPIAPPKEAPLAQRILARRQRMISSFLLVSLLLMIFELPLDFSIPNKLAPLVNILILICMILAIPCNRKGWSIQAGFLPIIGTELALCFNLLTIPGGLRVLDLPAFDLFAPITLTAILLLPPWYVFLLALGNSGIICALLLLAPKAADLHHLMTAQPIVFVVPIFLQIITAIISYYGGHSALKAVKETDRADEMQQLYREQAQVALTDALTGLPNHRAVVEQLQKELDQSRSLQRSLSLIFFDADRFKHVNDTYGHAAGDAVLRQIGEQAGSVLREGDTLGRFGGEEFVIILPDTDMKEAQIVAERIRLAVAAKPMATSEIQDGITMTVSIGLSTYPTHGDTEKVLLSEADEAMYAAKRLGRNQVRTAAEIKEISADMHG